jgi:predicted nuclease of predicted toxin-antitoxin system
MKKLRLLLDQNLRVETKGFLVGLGVDAISTRDLGLERASDAEIAVVARTERRTVCQPNEGEHFSVAVQEGATRRRSKT